MMDRRFPSRFEIVSELSEKLCFTDQALDVEEVENLISATFRTRIEDISPRKATFYDTFDWRLHRDGSYLISTPVKSGVLLSWHKRAGGLRCWAELPTMPCFAWELPQGRFRRKLGSVIRMRRLLPLVDMDVHRRVFHILNADEKTVVRLLVDEGVAAAPGGSQNPLPLTFRILPIRGYVKAHGKLSGFLDKKLGLRSEQRNELELALFAADRKALEPSRKPRLKLEPDQRTDEALRAVLSGLLETMIRNQPGLMEDLDSEFLHDFRVSVRRTRSALSQVKQVFDSRRTSHFRGEFKWLGSITGPTRDLDVYLLKMQDYRRVLPPSVAGDLDYLESFLRQLKVREHAKLVGELSRKRYHKLLEGWREFLAESLPADPPAANSAQPIAVTAGRRIWRTWRQVYREGKAIRRETPAAALHELRITCKKLRYLLEFFVPLYPPAEIKKLISELKRLQDNLGDFNDYEVQQVMITNWALQMEAEGSVPVVTLLAMGRLVQTMDLWQRRARDEFHNRFATFSRNENRRRFRSLFKQKES